jgi:hypothetical protein
MPEPPYGIICNRLKAGKVIPFLGAGASLVGRGPNDVWDARDPAFLPSGCDLAEFLADEAEFPSDDAQERGDLAKVTSYYLDRGGSTHLARQLAGGVKPGAIQMGFTA